jgi:enoyl-CoA hydratase
MAFDNLLIEREPPVAVIAINRPAVRNALNRATLAELRQVLTECRHDSVVRVLIITGVGDKSFVSGADISEIAVDGPVAARDFSVSGHEVFALVERLGKPVIAAINGYALGAGCELAMACTLRIAADTATLGQPEINLGLLPGYAGTQRLPRLIGKGRALELMLTGARLSAADAERIGLVNRVVPAAELMSEARRLAAVLAGQAPLAVRAILDAINHGLEMPFDQACAYEAALFGLLAATADVREGTRAFLEKRAPVFQGR